MARFRQNKDRILKILANPEWEQEFTHFLDYEASAGKVVSPLFSALYSSSPTIRWHAVSCFGVAVPRLAETAGLEQARVVMRRFTWNLNEESGCIGWGIPESMGEVMAAHSTLAREYHQILLSYILQLREADNYLDCLPLREGAYWGIARLAKARPELILPFTEELKRAIQEESSSFILACACLIQIHVPGLGWDKDQSSPLFRFDYEKKLELTLYWDKSFQTFSLRDLALQAREAGSSA